MVSEISWLNGRWSCDTPLQVSIRNRGLLLGDGIFETILLLNGEPQLFLEHIKRWENSASLLDMSSPPTNDWLRGLIYEAVHRLSEQKANGAIRLNWSRGEYQDRGINIPKKNNGQSNFIFWLDLSITEPSFSAISTTISRHEKRNADSRLSHCKTFSYTQGVYARQEAKSDGYDDALLMSTSGGICCGTTANLIVRRNNEWITPPLKSGCLPGIMRQQGINRGLFKEVNIDCTPQEKDEWLLINSLSCHPIRKVNDHLLNIFSTPESLWLSLLEKKAN